MATPVVFNAVNYSIPAFGDVGYAQGPGNLSSYLIALATGTLQPTGGLFSLTADANFGPNFGLVSLYYKTTSTPLATAGQFRMAVTDTIQWRNNANTLNLPLAVNGSDQLTFNGVILSTAAIAGTVNAGVAGRVTVYPAAGNTVDDIYVQNSQNIDILIAAQASRSVPLEYTIPNPGNAVAAATFALLQLAQTFAAAQTFATTVTISATTNQIVLGTTNTVTITSPAPAASRIYTIPDVLGAASFVMTAGAQSIAGVKTFTGGAGAITMSASTLEMGSNKITGLANGTVATDAAAFGQITAQTATTSINGTFIGMGRNRIVNGEMRIDQANGGAAVTVNATSNFSGIDMVTLRGTAAAGVFTSQRVTTTPPTGFAFQNKITVTTNSASPAAGARYELQDRIEGMTVRDFLLGTANAKQFTLSFWVRSSLTGTFGVGFTNDPINRSYVATYVINAANTWEQKTITLTGDTTGTWISDASSYGIAIVFDLGSGSSFETTANVWSAGFFYRTSACTRLISTNAATLELTGLQLELGSVATSFEYRLFTTEVQLCQRYYEKTSDLDAAPNTVTAPGGFRTIQKAISATASDGGNEMFQVIKRTTPTMSGWHPDAGTANTWTANAVGGNVSVTPSFGRIGVRSFDAGFTGGSGFTAGQACYILGHWVADARI